MWLRGVLLLACLTMPVMSRAQQRTSVPDNYDPAANDPFKTHSGDPDEMSRNEFLKHRMAEARKTERKRRMVDTANRLVVLTKQLEADLNGREATPDDAKRLDEIAKLARMVKDQMRN